MMLLRARTLRLLFGLLGLSAIFTEIIVLIAQGAFNPYNFFSFFTVLSNIAAASFLIYYGITDSKSKRLQVIRGAVTLYMLMTGVIFALLLSGLADVQLTAVAWDNTVLHYIMPIFVVVDWLVSPPKKVLAMGVIKLWILFPIVYVVYTLVRGGVVMWYPYPFLNPQLSSYVNVAITSVIIAVFVLLAAFVLRFIGTRRRK